MKDNAELASYVKYLSTCSDRRSTMSKVDLSCSYVLATCVSTGGDEEGIHMQGRLLFLVYVYKRLEGCMFMLEQMKICNVDTLISTQRSSNCPLKCLMHKCKNVFHDSCSF
jgi:hypothetical protein